MRKNTNKSRKSQNDGINVSIIFFATFFLPVPEFNPKLAKIHAYAYASFQIQKDTHLVSALAKKSLLTTRHIASKLNEAKTLVNHTVDCLPHQQKARPRRKEANKPRNASENKIKQQQKQNPKVIFFNTYKEKKTNGSGDEFHKWYQLPAEGEVGSEQVLWMTEW